MHARDHRPPDRDHVHVHVQASATGSSMHDVLAADQVHAATVRRAKNRRARCLAAPQVRGRTPMPRQAVKKKSTIPYNRHEPARKRKEIYKRTEVPVIVCVGLRPADARA